MYRREILARLHRYEWNERPLTELDFYRICEAEQIEIIAPGESNKAGAYFHHAGRHFIHLHPKLRGPDLLIVAFHELAHYFQHSPLAFYSGQGEDKYEFQANVLASLAIVPTAMLAELYNQRFADLPEDFLRFRQTVWEVYEM